MKKLIILLNLLFVFFNTVFAQESVLNEIRQNYRNFNYQKVIELADLAVKNSSFNDNLLIEIYTMKAVSQITLNDEENARKSFFEILKIDNTHQLDPSQISPKIISFFDNAKRDYIQLVGELKTESEISDADSIRNAKTNNLKSSIIKSIILPGWGHISRGEKTKGYILSGLSLATIGSMIYYIAETNNKEKDYLNETNALLINKKYNDFNDIYKIRNTIIISYAAIWIYSQIDNYFFNNSLQSENILLTPNPKDGQDLSISFGFNF